MHRVFHCIDAVWVASAQRVDVELLEDVAAVKGIIHRQIVSECVNVTLIACSMILHLGIKGPFFALVITLIKCPFNAKWRRYYVHSHIKI